MYLECNVSHFVCSCICSNLKMISEKDRAGLKPEVSLIKWHICFTFDYESFAAFCCCCLFYFISMNWITLKLQYTRIISSKNIIVFVDDMEKIWGTVAAISFPFHFCYRVCQFCLDRGNLICSILAWHSFVCVCVLGSRECPHFIACFILTQTSKS